MRTTPPDIANREVRRYAVDFELREADDGMLDFRGYASVVGVDYEMYGGPDKGGWIEEVDPGAFRRTLASKPDVQLLLNHDGLPLARTKSGTLTLDDDSKGLLAEARLDPADPDVAGLRIKVDRGDLDEMSFAFRTLRQEWDDEYERRTLLEVSLDRGDVSIVNYGANPATSFDLRSLLEQDPDLVMAELRAATDGHPELIERVRAALDAARSDEEPPAPLDEPRGMPLGLARTLAASL